MIRNNSLLFENQINSLLNNMTNLDENIEENNKNVI